MSSTSSNLRWIFCIENKGHTELGLVSIEGPVLAESDVSQKKMHIKNIQNCIMIVFKLAIPYKSLLL